MSVWALLIGMTAITFLNRYAFFPQQLRYTPGERVRRLLSYSSYAILTALWAPIIFKYEIPTGLQLAGWDYLIAASLACILSVLRVPSIIVVLVSASVFFGLRWFIA